MTNRPKAIGTWTETSIVRYLRAHGFGGADEMTAAQRLTLHGSQDHGDIAVCPGVMIESKGGHAAEMASDEKIREWLEETERERIARGADIAALVTKRKGKGRAQTGSWWAHVSGRTFVDLAHGVCADQFDVFDHLPAVRMTLAHLVTMLRAAGYGDPLPGTEIHLRAGDVSA